MVNIFQDFTTTLVVVGVLLAVGIIFEKQFLGLEDRFDAWVEKKKNNRNG